MNEPRTLEELKEASTERKPLEKNFILRHPGGHTMIIDEGLPIDHFQSITTSGHVSSVKLAYGTALLESKHTLRSKIHHARYAGIDLFTGGTLFEWAHLRGMGRDIILWCAGRGFSGMEISNTIAGLTWKEISMFCDSIRHAGMKPLIEIGAKFDRAGAPAKNSADWHNEIMRALDCDPWKIVLEGRASGTAGIFEAAGTFNEEAAAALDNFIIPDIQSRHLETEGEQRGFIIEAPMKAQQVTMIRRYGPAVGLGNVRPADVLSVAALRHGLRMDTFPEVIELFGGAK